MDQNLKHNTTEKARYSYNGGGGGGGGGGGAGGGGYGDACVLLS